MIKSDQLREFRPAVYYKEDISIEMIQETLKDNAMQMGIPVAFSNEQVKSGGLFNSSLESCIVMYHPEHENDYFKFCIRIKKQGTYTYVYINDFGESKQMKKANTAEMMKNDRKGKELSYQFGSMVGQAFRTLGNNKQKLEEEQIYYQCVFNIFDEIIK